MLNLPTVKAKILINSKSSFGFFDVKNQRIEAIKKAYKYHSPISSDPFNILLLFEDCVQYYFLQQTRRILAFNSPVVVKDQSTNLATPKIVARMGDFITGEAYIAINHQTFITINITIMSNGNTINLGFSRFSTEVSSLVNDNNNSILYNYANLADTLYPNDPVFILNDSIQRSIPLTYYAYNGHLVTHSLPK